MAGVETKFSLLQFIRAALLTSFVRMQCVFLANVFLLSIFLNYPGADCYVLTAHGRD